MIKLKPLEYFIFCVLSFLLGVVIYYNFPYVWLFLIAIFTFFSKLRLPVIFALIGFFATFIRLWNLEIQTIQKMEVGEVRGKIEKLYFKKGDLRAILKTNEEFVKVIASFKGNPDLSLGDELFLKGFFVPLPKRVHPHFYDVETKNKFNKISGYFSVKQFDVVKQNFNILEPIRRHILAILNKFERDDAKSIALALLLGDKGLISKEDYSIFKKSGLAHILAISGLHMSIVCVLVFSSIFRILSVTNLYKRLDTRKISALFGLLFGLFYLLLAGVPISGLRSFLMVILMFVSVFFLRGGGVRSLAISMLFIMIFWPEEVFFPSFQLSFVSVLCLLKVPEMKIKSKILDASLKTAISSIFVSFLTIPFAIHHFGYIHFYGAISNILAIPILACFIMPFAILSLTGFQAFVMIFEKGIVFLIWLAGCVANFPFSSIFMLHLNGFLLCLYSFFLIFLLCFQNKIIKFIGLFGVIGVFLTYFSTAKKPFLVANQDYVVMQNGENYLSLFYIPSGFLKDVWEEKLNTSFMPIKSTELKDWKCFKTYCTSQKYDFTIIFQNTLNLPCETKNLIKYANLLNQSCHFEKVIESEEIGIKPILFY